MTVGMKLIPPQRKSRCYCQGKHEHRVLRERLAKLLRKNRVSTARRVSVADAIEETVAADSDATVVDAIVEAEIGADAAIVIEEIVNREAESLRLRCHRTTLQSFCPVNRFRSIAMCRRRESPKRSRRPRSMRERSKPQRLRELTT
jgi:hypothetical protein